MSTTTDTLQISKYLKTLKFSDVQAEGIAEIVHSIEEKRGEEMVSKLHFDTKLQAELMRTENKLIVWMISIHIASIGLLIATKILS